MATLGPVRKSLPQLLTQAWNEIPEIIGSSFMGIIGITMAVYSVNEYCKNNGDNRRYKATYCIMRPDDPRVKLIIKDKPKC